MAEVSWRQFVHYHLEGTYLEVQSDGLEAWLVIDTRSGQRVASDFFLIRAKRAAERLASKYAKNG